MTRGTLLLVGAALLFSGCNRAPENEQAIRQALVQHLEKNAALDMSQLDMEVGDLTFKGNEATAVVSFKPKTAPQQGMSMTYTLERRGDEWHVKGRGTGHGDGMKGMSPGMGGGAQTPQSGELPAGHPPVNSPGGTKGGELPEGHPPVNAPPPPAK